jgi:ribosomal protein L11 methylase PrmA
VSTQRGLKENFVSSIVDAAHRSSVWDLGANDGHFSRVAARNADLVVAADADELVIDRLFRSLAGSGPGNVLPLVFDLADPSPGLGWRGKERRRLEERARPDLVLFLAVVHHLVISANLPLAEVIDWLATLGAEVVFEWVPPDDPMARRIAVNKRPHEIHPDYNEESLRALLRDRFVIRSEAPLEQRTLFHLSPPS